MRAVQEEVPPDAPERRGRTRRARVKAVQVEVATGELTARRAFVKQAVREVSRAHAMSAVWGARLCYTRYVRRR